LIARGIWLPGDRRVRRTTASAAQQSKKVLLEDQAQHQQDQRATDPQVHASKLESSPTASAFIPAIFNILAFSAWCPLHFVLLPRDLQTMVSL
jgi:hypothetical protein